jgi:hypothetical protein
MEGKEYKIIEYTKEGRIFKISSGKNSLSLAEL